MRNKELKTLWHSFIVGAMNSFLFNFIPTLVSVLTFATYVLLGHELTAAQAFTALSLFTVSPGSYTPFMLSSNSCCSIYSRERGLRSSSTCYVSLSLHVYK